MGTASRFAMFEFVIAQVGRDALNGSTGRMFIEGQ